MDEEDDDPFHLMSSSSSDDDEEDDTNKDNNNHSSSTANNINSSNGKNEKSLEKMDETTNNAPSTSSSSVGDGVAAGNVGVTSAVAVAQIQVDVEQVDFVRKDSSGTIGIATKTLDLEIMEAKPVDVSKKYLENYGFDLSDDDGNVRDMKELFEKHKDFNAKKIESQRKRWQEFIQKHNIGAKGFTTLEEYEQQRIFHFIEESNDFKKLVRKGIPMEYRAVMWYIIR